MTHESRLHENRVHGDAMFPFSSYFVVLTPGPYQQSVGHHWHEEAEFVLVTKGRVNAQIGTSFLTLNCGESVLVHPEEIHSLTAPSEAQSECYAIVFNLKMLSSFDYDRIQHRFLKPLMDGTSRFPLSIFSKKPWHSLVISNLQNILELDDKRPPSYELGIKGHLFLTLYHIAANEPLGLQGTAQSADNLNLLRLKKVLTYIEAHASEKIRLKDLASLVNMSEGHFCRYFKRMTNKKPVEYMNEFRVNFAAELLKSTDRAIMDVAFDVGFDNLSYFIKVFRSVKHCTPSEFRRQTLESPNSPHPQNQEMTS